MINIKLSRIYKNSKKNNNTLGKEDCPNLNNISRS